MLKIGFVVNPIAGMGGRVALKGTDGVVEEAIRRGAKPVTPGKARRFLESIRGEDLHFLTVSGSMGENILREFEFGYEVVYKAPPKTSAEDTRKACREFLSRSVALVVFVGGDGTARDVVSVVDSRVPILGVPSGVKMYSSVFCVRPEKCGAIIEAYARGDAKLRDGEVLDIDEDAYRNNVLKIKLYGFARVPYVEDAVQSSKSEYGVEDEEDKEAIAEFFAENVEPGVLYLLGAGTTIAKIAEKLGVEKTLLGVDAYLNGSIIARDLSEREILDLLDEYGAAKLVVTPIGSQGFVFGRGNQQISERVLCRIGRENIIIVATPLKIMNIDKLRMDLENCENLRGYYRVLIGYGKYRMVKME